MSHPFTISPNRCQFAHYLPERQEGVVIEALRLLDFNGDRPDARELADALENDTWLCVTADPREAAPTAADDDDDGYPERCSNPNGHEWSRPESESDRCYCVWCGADGDA